MEASKEAKTTKTRYKHQTHMGTIGDMKNLEQHYALMAEQGWMIDKIGLLTHRYHEIEPCKMRFFVDLLPQITAFDYPENEDAQEYRRICEESGWAFVAANKQFHVFCADGAHAAPIPIHTDNKIQAKIYLKACRKYELPWFIYALVMIGLFSPLHKGIDIFLSNLLLFMAIGYCFFGVGLLWTFGFMVRWYCRTRTSAKKDLPMPTVHYSLARWRNNIFGTGVGLFLLCTVAGGVLEIINGFPVTILLVALLPLLGIFVGLWIRRQVDTKRRTRGANIRLAVVSLVLMELVILVAMGFVVRGLLNTPFYRRSLGDRPVLTLHDIGVTTPPDSSDARIKSTMAVPVYYEYWAINHQGTVRTTVLRSISTTLTKAIYEQFANEIKTAHDYVPGAVDNITDLAPDDAAYWGAEEGLARSFNDTNRVELLLRHDTMILQLSLTGENANMTTVHQAILDLWPDAT